MNETCKGCTGTCCTGVGSDPCVCVFPTWEDRIREIRAGREFVHARYVNEDGSLAECRVTRIKEGTVYYMVSDGTGEALRWSDYEYFMTRALKEWKDD